MKKIILLFALIAGVFSQGCKQNQQFTIDGKVIKIDREDVMINIAAVDDDIIKVYYSDGKASSSSTYGPVQHDYIDLNTSQRGNVVYINTNTTQVSVDLSTYQITIADVDGSSKLLEAGSHISYSDSSVLRFVLADEEAIYGTGGRAIPMNRRGYQFESYNKPQYGYGWGDKTLNYCLPQFMSSNDYMLLIDDPSRARIDISSTDNDIMSFTTSGDNLTYYFINGNSFRELIGNYTSLTGTQPLPPIWSLGHLQSRFGYRNRAQAEKILNQAIAAGYPVDALIIDIYWFGHELEDGKMGHLSWDLDNWPDPKGMIENFSDLGVKTVTVSEPFFTRKSQHYQYLSDNKYLATDSSGNTLDIQDFYFGVGGLLDIFNPDAKAWMWEQYKGMKSYGIDGWWVDLGEPEKHPDSMYHINGPANLVHGLYGHEWAKMLAEGYSEEYPEERLFHMGRAGYAGTQRYGLIPWTGDVGRNWSGFKAQPSMVLSMGLSGLGYMHTDAGGFSMAETDEELYTRWIQFAAFTPIFRPHADESIPSEPVLWPDEVQKIIKPYVELRYRMLPYNYTLAWENSTTGMPMARPMFTAYPDISDTIDDQYMWGDAMMVCPVMKKGQKEKTIQIPVGKWYNYQTNETVLSGDHSFEVGMDHIPVFVKEGSIIPESPVIQSTDYYTGEDLVLNYYYSADESQSAVYFDDGTTPDAYAKGLYHLLKFDVEHHETGFSIHATMEGSGWEGSPENRNYQFKVIGLENPPKNVIGEDSVEFTWDSEKNILTFYIDCSIDQTMSVELK